MPTARSRVRLEEGEELWPQLLASALVLQLLRVVEVDSGRQIGHERRDEVPCSPRHIELVVVVMRIADSRCRIAREKVQEGQTLSSPAQIASTGPSDRSTGITARGSSLGCRPELPRERNGDAVDCPGRPRAAGVGTSTTLLGRPRTTPCTSFAGLSSCQQGSLAPARDAENENAVRVDLGSAREPGQGAPEVLERDVRQSGR